MGGMTLEEMIETTLNDWGMDSRDQAHKAVHAVLETLGGQLQPDDREALREELRLPAGEVMFEERYEGPFDETTFYRRVEALSELAPGRAREVAQVVGRLISERLSPRLRERLERHSHPSLAHIWDPGPARTLPPYEHAPKAHAPPPGHGHTLATGNPSSQHPVSEAGPLGQPDSVATTDEPYADRKLSSAHGTTAEQKRRTLSEGRPGSEHPISESGD